MELSLRQTVRITFLPCSCNTVLVKMVCFTRWNYMSLIPCPRHDAEDMTACGLVPYCEITTLTLANRQLCEISCYIPPLKQTVQEWAKPPQLRKDFFWWSYKWFWVHDWKKMHRENPGDRSRQTAKSYKSCLMCTNNIHASIVSEMPCYVCSLKACAINLKQPLQLAHLLSWWMENGGWEVGEACNQMQKSGTEVKKASSFFFFQDTHTFYSRVTRTSRAMRRFLTRQKSCWLCKVALATQSEQGFLTCA